MVTMARKGGYPGFDLLPPSRENFGCYENRAYPKVPARLPKWSLSAIPSTNISNLVGAG